MAADEPAPGPPLPARPPELPRGLLIVMIVAGALVLVPFWSWLVLAVWVGQLGRRLPAAGQGGDGDRPRGPRRGRRATVAMTTSAHTYLPDRRLLLAAALLLGCGQPAVKQPTFDDRPACAGSYGVLDDAGTLGAGLVEVSGIAASPTTPGLLWMIVDGGQQPLLFAVRADGSVLGRVTITGATFLDVEDLAAAHCPDGDGFCLFLSDTGDNGHARTDANVTIVREPTVALDTPFAAPALAPISRVAIHFPAGEPIDVEALAVAADGRTLLLFEKIDGPRARVFRLAAPFTGDLALMTTLDSPGVSIRWGRAITGADLHPSGTRLALRVYTGVFEYRFTDVGALGATPPTTVLLGPLTEGQGEAIAYDGAGTGLWSASEDPQGATPQMLHHLPCGK